MQVPLTKGAVGSVLRKAGKAQQAERATMTTLMKFWREQSGATAIEYSLIAAFIGIAIIGVLQTVGVEVRGPYSDTTTGLKGRTRPA